MGLCVPALAAAQTTFEVQGGGSTQFDGYGGLLNFWSSRFDGWAGVGWQDGWRVGAFARTEWRRDTLRLGNDVVVLGLPTDLFGSGTNVLVQGLTLVRARGGASYRVFGGASSVGLQAPLFSAVRARDPLGAVQVVQPLNQRLTATGNFIVARRHTALAGLEWQPRDRLSATGVAGVGSNVPYGALGARYDGERLDWRAALVGSGSGFQRVAVPMPQQTEADGVNASFTFRPTGGSYVGAGRQQFRRDSIGADPLVAIAYNVTGGASVLGVRIMASLFRSELLESVSYAGAFGAGRSFGERLSGEYYLLLNDAPTSKTHSSLFQLREVVTQRLQLTQHVSVGSGQPRGGVGGTLLLPFGSVSAEYQLQHIPFNQDQPFSQSLVLSASLQLGDYRTSITTQLDPQGRVAYSATGSTFLYLNQLGGVRPQSVGISMERFVVRGIVRDDAGNPVEGAAIDVEGQVAYTNLKGEFFVRVPRPRAYRLLVLPDEFLGLGQYEVVSLPETAQAAKAADAVPAAIVLRRKGAQPAPSPVRPDTTRPPASPAPAGAT